MLRVFMAVFLAGAIGVKLDDFDGKNCIPKKVIVSGVVRDQRAAIPNGVAHMLRIAKTFCDYHLVLYENDSKDGTANAIKAAFAGIADKATLISEYGVASPWPGRTGRITVARQKLLEHIKTKHGSSDFVIFTDIDFGAGTANWAGLNFGAPVQQCIPDTSSIEKAIKLETQWDVLSFKATPYWDVWALRDPSVAPENIWRDGVGNAVGWQSMLRYSRTVANALARLQPHEFLPVESAFMLLEIIKTPMLNNVSYSDPRGDCEHVSFHKMMTARNKARVRISAMNLCKQSARPNFNGVLAFSALSGDVSLASEQNVRKCMREGGTPDTCFLSSSKL